MRELLSALGAFEVVDDPKPSADPMTWTPEHWYPYPQPVEFEFPEKPWIRPAQLAMSFVGEWSSLNSRSALPSLTRRCQRDRRREL